MCSRCELPLTLSEDTLKARPSNRGIFQTTACSLMMFADGQHQGYCFDSPAFAAGDVVTVELERAPGVDGVLRVWEAGKMPQELRGSPSDGMICPIVCLGNKKRSYTVVALP